jgi:hypothetical protein
MRGVEVQLHSFLTLALDGGEWSAPHTDCFTPEGRAPGAYRIGICEDPRASLDVVGGGGKKTNVLPMLGVESRILGYPARSVVSTDSIWFTTN